MLAFKLVTEAKHCIRQFVYITSWTKCNFIQLYRPNSMLVKYTVATQKWFLLFRSFNLLMASNTFVLNLWVFLTSYQLKIITCTSLYTAHALKVKSTVNVSITIHSKAHSLAFRSRSCSSVLSDKNRRWGRVIIPAKGVGSYLAGMAVAIPILNVDGRRHTNNFSKNI